MPNVGTDKILFGTNKIFMRIQSANQLDLILAEKVRIKKMKTL